VVPGGTRYGIFGNDGLGGDFAHDKFIQIISGGELRIGYGSGKKDITSFPSKANPTTLTFSVLSVHYNSVQVNDSLVYCNGKYVANFMVQSNTGGENTLNIGSISSNLTRYKNQKQIAYFSL